MFGAYEALVRELLQSDEAWDAASLCHTPSGHLTLFKSSNDTTFEYPEEETLRSMFEHAAEAHPDRVALCDDHLEITYARLGNIADGLAATLSAKDVSREDKVLVFMDKGWSQVAQYWASMPAVPPMSPWTLPRRPNGSLILSPTARPRR